MNKGDPMKNPNIKIFLLIILTGLVVMSGASSAQTKTAPETSAAWQFHSIVDAAFVKAHISVPMPDNVMLIDARPYKGKYIKGHIPGAVSIPDTDFDKKTDLLPKDKNTLLIYYCQGLKCKLSHKSAQKAEKLGYTNVKVYAKGYPDWKKQFGASGESIAVKAGEIEGSIDLEKFKEILAKKPESITLIDVRDADEFAKGHIKTAANIPVENLEAKIKDLPTDKPIVYVCSTGARSGEAFYMTREVKESLKDVYYVEAQIDFNADGTYKITKNQ